MRYPDLRDWYAPDRELTPPRREDPSDIGLSCGEVASAYCVDTSAIIGVTELPLLPAPKDR
eukprot:gene17399-13177_t